jgi:hypothetical protein
MQGNIMPTLNYSIDKKYPRQRYCVVHVLRESLPVVAFRQAFGINPEDLGPCGRTSLTEKEAQELEFANLGKENVLDEKNPENAVATHMITMAGDNAVGACAAHANLVRDISTEMERHSASFGKNRRPESVDMDHRMKLRSSILKQRALDAFNKLVHRQQSAQFADEENKSKKAEEEELINTKTIGANDPAPVGDYNKNAKSPYAVKDDDLEDFEI